MNIFKKFWNKLFKRNGQVDLEEIARLNSIIEQLTNENKTLTAEKQQLFIFNKSLQSDKKQKQSYINKLLGENSILKSKNNGYEEQVKSLEKKLLRALSDKQSDRPYNNKCNTISEPMGQIKLNLHGFSTNDMYQYCEPFVNSKGELQDCTRTEKYDLWEKQFFAAMDKVTNNGKSAVLMFDHINFNRPLKIDVCFGMLPQYDGDNMIKSFLDTLVKYHRAHNKKLKNDNGFLKYTIEKKPVASRKEGFIQFSISNI